MFGGVYSSNSDRKKNIADKSVGDIHRKSIISAVVIMGVSLMLFILSGSEENRMTDNSVLRNPPGGGGEEYRLNVTVDEIEYQGLEIDVAERRYSEKECKDMSMRCREEAIYALLNKNKDLTEITDDLKFFEYLDGFPFTFSFESDTPEFINSDGEILTDKEFISNIDILFEYEDFVDGFTVKVHVIPGPGVKARVYRNEILAKLDSSENVTEETVKLPTELMGKKVSYSVPPIKCNPIYLFLGGFGSFLALIGTRLDERKKEEKRKEGIAMEYPVLLQKMALYLATGMTIRNIYIAIYEEGRAKKGNMNPMYQEMGISVNELQSGASEGMVYKRFGERTKMPELVRFTALLAQNLRKGSSKLKELLDEEASRAFIDRKQRAIKKGEEAGTKLLFPMMILLFDVLVMIMVPAFLSI